MNLRTILSIALLISFFLPWINTPLFTLSGYDIPISIQKLNNIFTIFDDNNEMANVIIVLMIVFYLVPILAAYRILKNFSKLRAPNYTVSEFSIGLMITILIFLLVKEINENALAFLSIGFYSTFLFSLLGFLNSFSNRVELDKKEYSPSFATSKASVNEDTIDRSDLINQLSQLQMLKEKGVITDEIFEKQKTDILEKLNPINVEDSTAFQDINESEHIEYEENVETKNKWYEKPINIVFGILIILVLISSIVYYREKMEQEATTTETSNIEISDDELYNVELTIDDFYTYDAYEFAKSYSYLDYGYIEGRITNFYENNKEDKRMIITITKMPTQYNYELNENIKVGSEMEIMAEPPTIRKEIYDKIMVVGRKIRFCINIEGSGGFTYLTYVKPLKE